MHHDEAKIRIDVVPAKIWGSVGRLEAFGDTAAGDLC